MLLFRLVIGFRISQVIFQQQGVRNHVKGINAINSSKNFDRSTITAVEAVAGRPMNALLPRTLNRGQMLSSLFISYAVFAARAPAMGNSADRAWQLSQLVEGVLTAFNPSHGSLSCVQAGRCVSKQIGRHDAACQGCPRCASRSPVLGTPQSRMALWGEEKQRSD